MGLFNWLAGLFGKKPEETPQEVADRLERMADRFRNAGDEAAANAALSAADLARQAPTGDAAQRIEAEFLRSRGLRPDGRPLLPVRGRSPDDVEYVRYGTTLRNGGSRAWRYNNPGYVRCSSRSTYYGALGCDGELAIFPDVSTGMRALRQSLRDDYPGHTVRDALQLHMPPEAGTDADRLCEEAGLDAATKTEDLTDTDCEAILPALERQPGWEVGEQFERGADDSPDWAESAWEAPAENEPAETDAAGAEAGDSDETSPTDNS
jgi:hypothetical protein